MPEKVDWAYLLERFTTNSCTREEFNQLLRLVDMNDNDELTLELRKYWEKDQKVDLPKVDWDEKVTILLAKANSEASRPVRKRYFHIGTIGKWNAVAAAVLIAWGMITMFPDGHISSSSAEMLTQSTPNENIIRPGKNKATLTLANGTVIALDSAQNGIVAREGDIKIFKGEDGELLYFPERQAATQVGAYNTVSTPFGGKYSVVLSDGTKVWLNAGSTLRYPASFGGNNRRVTLTGEGYFEVANDAHAPFVVTANKTDVQVLGTQFNVNAYADEKGVSTTLLEGEVKVVSDEEAVKLKPGEQANVSRDNRIQLKHNANLGEAIAWKNDFFEFDNVPVPVIMRQLARWYDIKVEYRDAVPGTRLTGKFSRDIPLEKVIKMLNYTGVNMSIDQRVLVVTDH